MTQFKTFQVSSATEDQGRLIEVSSSVLNQGELWIEVAYSSLNYKDALAVTGKGKILRSFPLTPGIDLAGKVMESRDQRFKEGDNILVTGCGYGENQNGGYSERQKVKADDVIALPRGLSLKEAMILGTAGFTAALAIHRMEQMGQCPEKGPIVVTGASGGVGSFAIQILSQSGYEVVAVSGKKELEPKLKALGATQVSSIENLNLGSRPLESARFGGAVDNLGGKVLTQLLASTALWGNVASIGLALDAAFEANVMPFILRGVSLLGVSSNNCPMPLRQDLWQKLASSWKPNRLQDILSVEITMDDLNTVAHEMLQRKTFGRTLVAIRPSL